MAGWDLKRLPFGLWQDRIVEGGSLAIRFDKPFQRGLQEANTMAAQPSGTCTSPANCGPASKANIRRYALRLQIAGLQLESGDVRGALTEAHAADTMAEEMGVLSFNTLAQC